MLGNFYDCLNIFYFLGLSVKSFDRRLKMCGNLLAIWSFSMVLVVVIAVALVICFAKPVPRDGEVKIFLVVTFYLANLNICVLVLSSILFRKAEKTVWELLELLEIIFVFEFKIDLHKKQFARRCWGKIFLEYLIFIAFSVATLKPVDNVRASMIYLMVTTIIRTFGIKFVFYVDALNFCLFHIEAKLRKGVNSIDELMRLKRAFTLCWRMSRSINDMFGWGLLTTSPMVVIGALYSVHRLSTEIFNNRLNIDPMFVIASIYIQTCLMANSSQRCSRYSSAIALLVFRQSSRENHKIVESFALQLMHQKIIFTCKDVYRMNHRFMISVSCLN